MTQSETPEETSAEAAHTRPLTILIGADTFLPHVNGAARFAERLAAGLVARGHDVHVMAPSDTHRHHGTFTEVISHLPDVLCVRAAVVVGNPAGLETPLAAAEANVLAEAAVIVDAAAQADGNPESPTSDPVPG